jgi:hypothetical protein
MFRELRRTIPGYVVHAPLIADESIIASRPTRRTRRRISQPEAEGGKALKIGSDAEAMFFGGAGQFVQYACDFTQNFLLRERLFAKLCRDQHLICQLIFEVPAIIAGRQFKSNP